MANCVQCGKEFPGTVAGEQSDICVECSVRKRIEQEQAFRAAQPAMLEVAKAFPVTATIVAINLAIYAACAIQSLMTGRGSPFDFTSPALVQWGANWGPLTLDGQFWRSFTSMFLHGGLIHVAANMWCFWEFGRIAERVYGRYRMLVLYLLAGLASSVASLAIHPTTVSVGASGAIFGVVGALVFPFYRKLVVLPPPVLKAMLRSLVMFIFINLAIGAVVPVIDNAAHLGGLIAGLALGAVITHFGLKGSDLRAYFPKIAALAAIGIVSAFIGVQNLHSDRLLPRKALIALQNGDPQKAIELGQKAVAKNPKNALAHLMLGEAYWAKAQYAEAAEQYRTTMELEPNNGYVAAQLGSAYVAMRKWNDAETVLRQALQDYGEEPVLLQNLGIALAGQGRLQEAEFFLSKSLVKNPRSARAQYALGSVLLDQQKYPEAVTALRQAVELSPDNSDYKESLAAAEAKSKQVSHN